MAAGSQSMSSFSAALKRYYPTNAWNVLAFDAQPFLAQVPKFTEWEGDSYSVPIGYAAPQGRSPNIAIALAGKTAAKQSTFLATSVSDYLTPSIKVEVIMASKDQVGAFVPAMTSEISRAMQQFKRATALALYGDGSGALGSIASGVPLNSATGTFSFQIADDILKLEVGQVLQAAITTTGAVLTGNLTVTALDRDNNLVTFASSTVAGGTAVTTYLFVNGDAPNGGALVRAAGMLTWIPPTTGAVGSLFGVPRDADRQRLAGVYVDLSGANALSPVETINKLVTRIVKYAGKNAPPDTILVPYGFWENLANDLLGKVVFQQLKPEGMQTSFATLVLQTAAGPVTVIPDVSCPSSYIFAVRMNTWKLVSRSTVPFLMDLDGQSILRESGDDALEARIQAYYQLVCLEPGANGVAKIL